MYEVTNPPSKYSRILSNIALSFTCKVIRKHNLTAQPILRTESLYIKIINEPSASEKPVIAYGLRSVGVGIGEVELLCTLARVE